MIEPAYFWSCVILLALGTFAIRGSIIAISSRVRIPDGARELFSYIPAAILPGFIAPAVFFHPAARERSGVLVLATILCFFTRSTLATVAFGLVALYVLRGGH